MRSLMRFLAPPGPCSYLPHETWRLEYEVAADLTREDYSERLLSGWRRFGATMFRPRCRTCSACRSLRVPVPHFRPDRSQRRVRKANESLVRLKVGEPSFSAEKLALYDRYHAHQARAKGWALHAARDVEGYANSFLENPFPTQEWCYYLGDRLVGVGYVDDLAVGLSAIYFFHDPDDRQLSLGTWNVLSILAKAASVSLPYVYLGYFVAGCRSMEYKARFRPHELFGVDGIWRSSEG